ncbi:MAG: DUF1080 domain-containing protein [Gemmatimonadetes bacterium]|nr:DUF1080 domain-containing protein [Gemmatimonadota bacterium]
MWPLLFLSVLSLCLPLRVVGQQAPLQAQQARSLFDARSLPGWVVTEFSDHGTVTVRDGMVILGTGNAMTGITWREDFPKINYEVTLEAMRMEGRDFFSTITFPVNDSFCSLVVGGWGGTVVGLSSIEGADASENETTRSIRFEEKRWYRIRLRVTDEKIQAWIDERQVVDLTHANRLLSIRVEVSQNLPFGIATWRTTGALRNLQIRELTESAPGL